MNTGSPLVLRRSFASRVILVATLGALTGAGPLLGQDKKKNPTSKMYVADVKGDAIIDTGESLEDLHKRSVYTAEGTIIETKKPVNESDREKHFSTMVYSNGTGAFFDADTRVEVKRFMQEPFTPNRNDMEVEPSISQTRAFVARGAVGLCTSKPVAGSNTIYQTPHASVNIRGRKVVIEAKSDVTKISMLEGESTVRAGNTDIGGHTLQAGEQAVIRHMAPGQPPEVRITKIPPNELPQLDDKVAMACMAKKTVYFEEREVKTGGPGKSDENQASSESEKKDGSSKEDDDTRITAFDGNATNASSVTIREIVPIEVVPIILPTEHVVSPSQIVTTGRGPGG